MSWRDKLRIPVSKAAKQGAAKLNQSLSQKVDVGKVPRKSAATATDPGPARAAPPRQPRRPVPPLTDVIKGGGEPPQSAGATALARQPTAQARPRLTPSKLPEYAVGDRIADIYEVRQIMARTQRCTVHVAHHLQWDIDVVLKAFQRELLTNAQAVQAIASGASRWTALGLHPHIAYCYHMHFVDEVPFLIIEHLAGGNLHAWTSTGRAANLRIGVNLAIQMCHGLAHAHARGVWHGALSPQNVLLAADGMVRLTDFGVAERGSAGVVAPEQWVDAQALDARTDIFALGVCFYEMFCGVRPYDVTRGPRREPLAPRPAAADEPLPERLSALLMNCVDWDQGRRPGTVAQVRDELCAVHTQLFAQPSPFAQPPPVSWDADGWNNQAMFARALGRASEAATAWENALTADPGHVLATYNYGIARWQCGELSDEALVRELKRLKVDSGATLAPSHLQSLVHLESGNAAAAVPLLEELARRVAHPSEVQETLSLARRQADAQQSIERELTGHLQFVSGVGITADGKWILSASDDNTLCLWETASGRQMRTFEGHTRRVSCVSLSDERNLALSAGDDFTMRLWDIKHGRCVRVVELPGKIFSASLSADGRRGLTSSSAGDNAVGSSGTLLQVWDLEKRRALRRLDGHTNAVKAVAIAADGKLAASGGDDQTVRVWDVTTGACLRVLEGHEHYVSCVALSADGTRMLSGGWDRTLRLWDIHKGRCLRVFKGHTGIVMSLCLSADGRFAVSGGWDSTVRVWEIDTGRCLRTFEGHGSMVTGVALSADARLAVSGSWDTTVRVWQMPPVGPHLCVPHLSVHVPYAELPSAEAGADELLATAERAVREQRFDEAADHLRRVRELKPDDENERVRRIGRALARACPHVQLRAARAAVVLTAPGRVHAGRLSGDGQRLLTGGRDGHVRLWDVDLKRCVRSFDGHTDRVLDVCVGASHALAVSASADWSLRVWDLAAGICLRVLTGHRGMVSAVSMSADERAAVSVSYDHTVRLWNLASGDCIRVLRGHTRQISAVCLSADGRVAVSGGYDCVVRVWDVGNGRCLHGLDGHTGRVTALCMSADGQRVLSGSTDGTLRVWDVPAGRCVQVLSGHNGAVTAAALSADGRWIVSARRDGTVRLWDPTGASGPHVIYRGTMGMTCVALSGDDCTLMAADAENRIHLFELDWEVDVRDATSLPANDLHTYGNR